MPIIISPDERTFFLQLERSFYLLRRDDDGALLHVAAGETDSKWTPEAVAAYDDPTYLWSYRGRRHELPCFGDEPYADAGLKVSFRALPGVLAAGEAAHLPVRDLRLRYVSHEIRTDSHPALASERPNDTRQTLVLHLKDAVYDFHARLFYRLTPECDVIERWVEIENCTGDAIDVDIVAFGCVHLPVGRYEVLHTTGAWAREFTPKVQELGQGVFELSQKGLNTGFNANPFYLAYPIGRATEEAGRVFFGALAYSGNWSLRFEREPAGATHVIGGYERSDFALTLLPGQTHTTAAMVHGVAHDGWGGASRRLHAFAHAYVLPATPRPAVRPVLYNSWEATYFDVKIDQQIALARVAADLGVELFCIDDGWFGGRRNERAGLGDWTVSPSQFPNGLKPMIDEVRRLGMRFGLWVEPEMVNRDSDLYRAHPDWVLHFPSRPRSEHRSQLVLDFGRAEVVQYIHGALDRLLRENAITFFKWDMNRYASEPGSVAGRDVWRRHVEAVYGIMDRLRADHPTLEIESCSGGGGRIDFGILQRTDQVWTSDNTDAIDRIRIQDGYSLAYPARAMEAWVTHDRNHQSGRTLSLDLRFDVAMRGALGIGTNLDRIPEVERGVYRRKIAFYKGIRDVVQNGTLYRLTSVVGSPGLSVWQTVSPDARRSVYSFVAVSRLQGEHLPLFPLRGLKPASMYRATDEHDNECFVLSGAQLMAIGVPGDMPKGLTWSMHSRTLLLTAL